MKPLVGHNPRDFLKCDSVPEGRQDVATGASPWYAMMERWKSRRDNRNCDWVVSCRPFRTENPLYFSNHGLAPVATPCRHIRGSNAGSIRPFCLSQVPFFLGKKSITALPNRPPPRWGSPPSSNDHHQKRTRPNSFATAELDSHGVDLRRAGDVNPLICRG